MSFVGCFSCLCTWSLAPSRAVVKACRCALLRAEGGALSVHGFKVMHVGINWAF